MEVLQVFFVVSCDTGVALGLMAVVTSDGRKRLVSSERAAGCCSPDWSPKSMRSGSGFVFISASQLGLYVDCPVVVFSVSRSTLAVEEVIIC